MGKNKGLERLVDSSKLLNERRGRRCTSKGQPNIADIEIDFSSSHLYSR
jgi:hypothetical protein